MKVSTKIKLRKVGIPIGFGLMMLYFGYHLFTGKHNLLSYYKLEQELDNTHAELDAATTERQSLQRRVELMRSDSLDLDLLDEQSRRFLGYADENEVIIFTDE